MTPKDLLDATMVLGLCGGDSRKLCKKLSGRARTTGLAATLDWLDDPKKGAKVGGKDLRRALVGVLDIPDQLGALAGLDNASLFALNHRAMRVIDALHLVSRAVED